MKIEVGTKVKIKSGYGGRFNGREGIVTGSGYMVTSRVGVPEHYYKNGDDFHMFFSETEIEPVSETTPITIQVGKTYELNNGHVHKCDMMNGDDPLAVDTYGFGPFVIAGILYHQDGLFGRRDDVQSTYGIKREVITIEPGKYYRTRGGRKVGPMVHEDMNDGFPYRDVIYTGWWSVDGNRQNPAFSDTDLISECTKDDDMKETCDERKDGPFVRDPELTSEYGDGNHPLPPMVPETGTLAELNVKAGDVVEFVKAADVFHPEYTETYGGTKSVVDGFGGTETHDDGSQGWSNYCTHVFRIISRASDTPKTWGELSDAEKGPIALAFVQGKAIERIGYGRDVWMSCYPQWKDDISYRIKPQPQRETVAKFGYFAGSEWVFGSGPPSIYDTHSITFTTIDGTPDMDSIKMEALG